MRCQASPTMAKPSVPKPRLKEFRDNVAALKEQGRSRDETVADKPTAAFVAKFGNFIIDPGFFRRLVYEGV
jgi:hypothetical protein